MPPIHDFERIIQKPESFLVLFNITKDSNFGFLIRTANAFGLSVIVVGRAKFSRGGATGKTQTTKAYKFHTLEEAIEFVRGRNCELVGIEIGEDSRPIWESEYSGPTAFMLGNEGQGLLPKQIAACDRLVHIPQYGSAVSLNVNVAGGIVFSDFARKIGYLPTPIGGRKFELEQPIKTIERPTS